LPRIDILRPAREEESPHIGNESANAHKQFRSVLRLCILVSTINGNGHPTLRWRTSDPQPQEKTPDYALLKYVTAILVRDVEIIAAMAHKPKVSAGSFSAAAPYRVNVMRTDSPASCPRQDKISGTIQNDQGVALPQTFTAVANPRTEGDSDEDPYFKTVPDDIDCLVVTGESHFLASNTQQNPFIQRVLKIR
jgi:hypothetical protein